MTALVLAVLLSQAAPTKEYKFEEEFVEASIDGPDAVQVEAVKRPAHESLLRTRKDFRAEVLRSDADLP